MQWERQIDSGPWHQDEKINIPHLHRYASQVSLHTCEWTACECEWSSTHLQESLLLTQLITRLTVWMSDCQYYLYRRDHWLHWLLAECSSWLDCQSDSARRVTAGASLWVERLWRAVLSRWQVGSMEVNTLEWEVAWTMAALMHASSSLFLALHTHSIICIMLRRNIRITLTSLLLKSYW